MPNSQIHAMSYIFYNKNLQLSSIFVIATSLQQGSVFKSAGPSAPCLDVAKHKRHSAAVALIVACGQAIDRSWGHHRRSGRLVLAGSVVNKIDVEANVRRLLLPSCIMYTRHSSNYKN